LGIAHEVNRLGFENKAALIMKIQDVICLINSLVVCQTPYQKRGVSLATDLKWLNAITGWEMTHEEFLRAGERIFNQKRLINVRRGYSGKDDTLPPRVMEKLLDLSDDEQKVPVAVQEQLQEYYSLRGWDKEGIPTQEKLLELQFT
jgi:aldehyde:ferredoxin oxidoreductase